MILGVEIAELFAKIYPKAYDNFIFLENGKKLCR